MQPIQKKIKFALLVLILLFGLKGAYSQTYMVAFGPRIGPPDLGSQGFSIKTVTKSPNVIEAIAHLAHDGFRVTGMYQYLRSFSGRTYTSGWHWFIGCGGHFANYPGYEYTDHIDGKIKRITYQGFGLDFIAGLEYSFSAPLSISIDMKPYYEVQTFEGAESHFMDISLSIRHTFF